MKRIFLISAVLQDIACEESDTTSPRVAVIAENEEEALQIAGRNGYRVREPGPDDPYVETKLVAQPLAVAGELATLLR